MKVCVLFLVLSFASCTFAADYSWCLANGGKVDLTQNKSCIMYDTDEEYYSNKIYDTLCIPYLSSILKNKEVVFLKLVGEQEKINKKENFLDTYNWKITKGDIFKYI